MNVFIPFAAATLVASLCANAYLIWEFKTRPVIVVQGSDDAKVIHVKGGLLEVSKVLATEQFDAATDETILGVSVGKTTARIRVPAIYRYHVALDADWKVLLKDKTFIVISPPVKPSLPVAIDTGKLEAQASGRWSTWTGDSRIASLQRSITQTLAEKADSSIYIQLQREVARRALQEFVQKWLVTQEQWKSASSYPIKVYFADEPIQTLSTMPQPFTGLL